MKKETNETTYFANEEMGNELNDVSINMDKPEVEESKGKTWKELSIGGTFGLLVAGGSLYASGAIKGDDSEALLAGAEAADSAQMEKPVETINNDPVLLDENGEPVGLPAQSKIDNTLAEPATPTSRATQSQHAPEAAASHRSDDSHFDNAHLNTPSRQTAPDHHIQEEDIVSTIEEANNAHTYTGVGIEEHPVNIIILDDDLSFAEAFATARAELGSGAAFCWRGGVYGTFNEAEWHSLSHGEQAQFTNVAVQEAAQTNYLANYQHTPHHHVRFTEGDVVNDHIAEGGAYDDTDDHVIAIDDDDVEIIESVNSDFDEQPQIIAMENSLDDLLAPDENMPLDIDTIDENDGLNAIAAIISDMSDMGADNDSMYDTMMPSNDYSTSDDSMPDYVSDADTADII